MVEQFLVLDPANADCIDGAGKYTWRIPQPIGRPWRTMLWLTVELGNFGVDFAVAEWDVDGVPDEECDDRCECGSLLVNMPVGEPQQFGGHLYVLGDELILRSTKNTTRYVYLRWER